MYVRRVERAHDAREDATGVDAHAQRQRSRALEDRPGGAQHQLLFRSTGRAWGSGEEDRLDGSGAHVRLREGDVERDTARLNRRDALVQRFRQRIGALAVEQRIGAPDLDERDSDMPVLGIGLLAPQLARVRRGEELGEVDPRRVEERRHHLGHVGGVRKQDGALAGRAEQPRVEQPRGRFA